MNVKRYFHPIGAFSMGMTLLVLGCVPLTIASSPEAGQPTAEQHSASPQPALTAESGSESVPAARSQAEVSQSASPLPDAGQHLPISAEAEINGQIIQLEVARTVQEQSQGLMYRPPLPDDRGMLFPFDPPRPVQFWMKNTPSPLDMVFLHNGTVQAIESAVPPCEADPCPTYGPDTPILIDQVLELRSGRATELGLEVGDRVNIQFLNE
jgi:uncharacterized membrane protein (UPF0127 family)